MGMVGIVCLTVLACVALLMKIDGMLLASITVIIGTAIGYAFGVRPSKKDEEP
jgi:xanthine/uracil permease